MNKSSVLAFCLLLLLVLSNCARKEKPDFTKICKDYFDDKNKLNPLFATFDGQNEYNDQLTLEMTDEFRRQTRDFILKYESLLAEVDESELSPEEKISHGMIAWELETTKRANELPIHLTPLNQFWGTHLIMAMLGSGTSAQPFKTEKDYRNFLKRMDRYVVWLDSAEVAMRKGIAQRIVMPKPLTEKIIPQFDGMITEKAEDNLFYSAIKAMPDSISSDTKKALTDDYRKLIDKRLLPQLRKMSAFLKNEYLPASRNTSGLSDIPQGKEMYAHYVELWTTTKMTPAEIHNIGLREVERIKKEMEAVKNQVGFKGTLNEFFAEVRIKKELMPFTKPEQVLEYFEAIHARIKPNVDKLFSLQPKSKFEIRRTEAYREKTASAEYLVGSADRPGIFYVPIPDATKHNVYRDEDLFLHEAIPGHHFQASLQIENKSLPDFRKYNNTGAYSEGWGLYCETLGKELGIYTDPYQYFGMLGGEMHRAVRLVVDTGIHSKGWTREQAIRYSLENEAESQDAITAEVERYMAIPGQALSYKIGQLKILELRRKAEKKLGKNFDIRKFHEKVLESGAMPLDLLEQKIDAWVADVR